LILNILGPVFLISLYHSKNPFDPKGLSQSAVKAQFKLVLHTLNANLATSACIGDWSKLYRKIAPLHLNLPSCLCDGLYCIPQTKVQSDPLTFTTSIVWSCSLGRWLGTLNLI
jgi:hypothetical protein